MFGLLFSPFALPSLCFPLFSAFILLVDAFILIFSFFASHFLFLFAQLKFLSSYGRLTPEHVDALWCSSQGKHESVVVIVYESIIELSANLSAEGMELIWKRIRVCFALCGFLSLRSAESEG
jgi:cellulose synthase/poly-beta-1,6-N-acetylglucosamine synthase-like glycosyltransferase